MHPNSSTTLYINLPNDITEAQKTEQITNFAQGRAHICCYIGLKLVHLYGPPHSVFKLAHFDQGIAIHELRRLLAADHRHPKLQYLCVQLREESELWAAGTPLSSQRLQNIAKFVGKLRFTNFNDRPGEAFHAKTHRSALGKPTHTEQFVSHYLRSPMIEEDIKDPDVLEQYVYLAENVCNPAVASKALGLDRHEALRRERHRPGRALRWDQNIVHAKVIYHAYRFTLYGYTPPQVQLLDDWNEHARQEPVAAVPPAGPAQDEPAANLPPVEPAEDGPAVPPMQPAEDEPAVNMPPAEPTEDELAVNMHQTADPGETQALAIRPSEIREPPEKNLMMDLGIHSDAIVATCRATSTIFAKHIGIMQLIKKYALAYFDAQVSTAYRHCFVSLPVPQLALKTMISVLNPRRCDDEDLRELKDALLSGDVGMPSDDRHTAFVRNTTLFCKLVRSFPSRMIRNKLHAETGFSAHDRVVAVHQILEIDVGKKKGCGFGNFDRPMGRL